MKYCLETLQRKSLFDRFAHVYVNLCKVIFGKQLGKDLRKMIMFCDWLSETKMIIVCDSFFRKTISIVLVSFIVI